jgi:hypothetical protein
MSAAAAFFTALFLTVALMLASLWTGLRRLRRQHLWLGPLTIASLAMAVVLAIRLGRSYTFAPGPMAIHRVFAVLAGLLGLVVAATGLLLLRRPALRAWHRRCALTFAVAAVCATVTGLWIWSGATPK